MTQADPTAYFLAINLAHCEDCKRAGVQAPTAEEWIELVRFIADLTRRPLASGHIRPRGASPSASNRS